MKEEIEDLIQKNKVTKEFLKYSKEELRVMRNMINYGLIDFYNTKENNFRNVLICGTHNYDCLEYMVAYKCRIDLGKVSALNSTDRMKNSNKCLYCNLKECVEKNIILFFEEVRKYNEENKKKINCIEVIDYILNITTPEFNSIPDYSFYKNTNVMDLLYVQAILEMDLVNIKSMHENIVEFNYLDITQKENDNYYINILKEFYKDEKNKKQLVLDLSRKDEIFNEKENTLRRYKIASYYKYLIEYEKADIIQSLRKIVKTTNVVNGIQIRSRYFIKCYFKKVEELPYSNKTKEKIYNILNYILNYKYRSSIPYIPINILIYSNDKEGVGNISQIIGEFMWYFGYLGENMKYYNEHMSDVILDKYKIKKIYYEYEKDNVKNKSGILVIHDIENLLYMDNKFQSVILNILTDEIEKNNRRVCTIIYGERTKLKQVLDSQKKLSRLLINLELEIDDLGIEKIYELTIEKLKRNMSVPEDAAKKIYNYIKATYTQSEFNNMDYVNKLYSEIVLNMNSRFSENEKTKLKIENIPDVYNIKDLPTIMKDLNNLVGLENIKEQINDLVSLLKFNKQTNIDIKDFCFHMCFTGSSGTGKTTVARIITEILYNLGYIKQNKLTEVTAKDLIGEYLGQTSPKTFNVVNSALGGVLFIDEAYSITNTTNKGNQFGNECIATLLKLMEDYRDRIIVIFAGYKDEMKQFLDSNPGLISRIGYTIEFPDYSIDELLQIFLNMLKNSNMDITESALKKLKKVIEVSSKNKNFGNGRFIRNIFQKILIEHAKNMDKNNSDDNLFLIDVFLITEDDINFEKLVFKGEDNKKIGF